MAANELADDLMAAERGNAHERVEAKRQQKPPSARSKRTKQAHPALWLGNAGIWLVVLSLGGLFFAVNGGFSILGVNYAAKNLNEQAAVFWQFLSAWTFRLPVEAIGDRAVQPVIPWLLVLGSSVLQIACIWLKLSDIRIPLPMLLFALLMSLYDAVSTFFGFGTVEWIQQAGIIVQILLTALFTFGLEVVIGYMLRKKE